MYMYIRLERLLYKHVMYIDTQVWCIFNFYMPTEYIYIQNVTSRNKQVDYSVTRLYSTELYEASIDNIFFYIKHTCFSRPTVIIQVILHQLARLVVVFNIARRPESVCFQRRHRSTHGCTYVNVLYINCTYNVLLIQQDFRVHYITMYLNSCTQVRLSISPSRQLFRDHSTGRLGRNSLPGFSDFSL
jgi:hypothetical protein